MFTPQIPGCPINNFTSDWTDGVKVGALVDSVAPGLCPDWEDWDPNEPIRSVISAQWEPRVNTDLVSRQCTVGKFGPLLMDLSCQ